MGRFVAVGVVVWGLLVGAQHVYAYATTSPRFEVRALVFDPTPHISDDRVRELMGLRPGTNILALELESLAGRIAQDAWVAKASVVRELPDTLIVQVEEHEPTAVMLSGYFYLINRDGKPFKRLERGERGDLPVISGIDRRLLLDDPVRAESRVDRALAVLRAYRAKKRPRLGEIHVGDAGDVTLYTAERGAQYRLGRGALAPKLARLDALRAALGAEADGLAVVHLDGSVGPGSKDRVSASFFSDARADNRWLAARSDQPEPKPDGDDDGVAKSTARHSRLPRAR